LNRPFAQSGKSLGCSERYGVRVLRVLASARFLLPHIVFPALLVTLVAGNASHSWLYPNKEAAIDFLAKEIPLKPELACKGWEYYTANRICHPNAEISPEGLKFSMEIHGEQAKGPSPNPLKYIDMSYLQQAIKELGEK
jgi:hypothetical protein